MADITRAGVIGTGREAALGRITVTTDLAAFADRDLVVEVATEGPQVKKALYAEYAESAYAPPPLLRRMTAARLYGRKSGRGFFDYQEQR